MFRKCNEVALYVMQFQNSSKGSDGSQFFYDMNAKFDDDLRGKKRRGDGDTGGERKKMPPKLTG